MARANIKDRDVGYREFLKKVADRHMRLAIGVPLSSARGKIASYLHEGTSRMPARPFLSQWFDLYREKNITIIFNAYKEVVHRAKILSYAKALTDVVGPQMVEGLRAVMRSGNFAPLAESTIRRKGSSLPLVDSGALVGDATTVVQKKA